MRHPPSLNESRRRPLAAILSVLLLVASLAQAEARDVGALADLYGALPAFRAFAISPDGRRYAYVQSSDGEEGVVVIDARTRKMVRGLNVSSMKARDVRFLSNEHVLIHVSKTQARMSRRARWEESRGVILRLDTGKQVEIMNNLDELHPAQSGLVQVVGLDAKDEKVFMPAFVGLTLSTRDLVSIDLDTGHSRVVQSGHADTRDWFMSARGETLAEVRFDAGKGIHRIHSFLGEERRTIFEKETNFPAFHAGAVMPDGRRLAVLGTAHDVRGVFAMSLEDGEIEGPLVSEDDTAGRPIEGILTTGPHRVYAGVALGGARSEALFADATLRRADEALRDFYGESTIRYVGGTVDGSRLVFQVSGNGGAEDYVLFNAETHRAGRLAAGYPGIPTEDIHRIEAIRYEARDGTSIPAIVTHPDPSAGREALPLIVLPHGGPAGHDSVRFDYMAQFFARLGYLVLQPNFRGSTGYGKAFRSAGRGEWGRKMQDDVTDGLKALIARGQVDPARVCIVGWSYGGYAALAGGAYTPELYRCVVAGAGVADLPLSLREEKRVSGRFSWAFAYWNDLIRAGEADDAYLRSISPAFAADRFQAPVLLIHGKDDTVVSPDQSKTMRRALRRAKKAVEYETVRKMDHWLTTTDHRRRVLRLMGDFVLEHNPPGRGEKAGNAAFRAPGTLSVPAE
ncbi:MAG: alpha/beta fold hydrolase [Myxococcota bacterium]